MHKHTQTHTIFLHFFFFFLNRIILFVGSVYGMIYAEYQNKKKISLTCNSYEFVSHTELKFALDLKSQIKKNQKSVYLSPLWNYY